MNIRAYAPHTVDDQNLAEFWSVVHPHSPCLGAAEVRDRLERMTLLGFKLILVVEEDGALVGHLLVSRPWWSQNDKVAITVVEVHPEHRGRGIGRALVARCAEALAQQPQTIVSTMVDDDDAHSVGFAMRRGLAPTMRFINSELSLSGPVSDETLAYVSTAEATGFTFMDGTEFARRFAHDWQRRWWRLQGKLEKDIPSVDPLVELPFETFLRLCINIPSFHLANWQFALVEDELVGLSGLRVNASNPTVAGVDLTGVLRNYRPRPQDPISHGGTGARYNLHQNR